MSREQKLKELERLRKLKQIKMLRAELEKPKERKASSFGGAVDTGFETAVGSTVGGTQQINSQLASLFRSDKSKGPVQPTMGDVFANTLSRDEGDLKKESQQRENRYRAAEEKSWLGAKFGNILGAVVSTAPLSAIPGLGLGANAGRLGRAGLSAGRGAAEGAGGAALQYAPEGQSRAQNAGVGALFGAPIAGAGAAASETFDAFTPSNLLGKYANKEEILKNMQAAKGTPTQLGQVIQNPMLSLLFENRLTKHPLSGAMRSQINAAEQTRGQASNIFNEIIGGKEFSDENVGQVLQQGLQGVVKDMQKMKRENYKGFNELAEKNGVKAGRGNLSDTALDLWKEIRESEELAEEVPDALKNQLKKMSNRKYLQGSLNKANIYKGILGDKAKSFYDSDNAYLGGVYSKLQEALKKDINDAIEGSGSEELKGAYKGAEEFYKKNIAPLDDPLIRKYAQLGGDPDTLINAFVKKDRPALLNKLTSQLSKSKNGEELMNALRYGVFKSAKQDKAINPNELAKIFNKFTDAQKKALFSGKEADIPKMENLDRLAKMNQKGLYAMFNPMTGYQETFDKFGPKGAMTGWGSIGPRQISNWMTSEETRENIINKILSEELRKPSKHRTAIGAGRTAGTIAAQNEAKPEAVQVIFKGSKK